MVVVDTRKRRNNERIFNNVKSRDRKETHDTHLTTFLPF